MSLPREQHGTRGVSGTAAITAEERQSERGERNLQEGEGSVRIPWNPLRGTRHDTSTSRADHAINRRQLSDRGSEFLTVQVVVVFIHRHLKD